jgi:hypothetical protein
MVMDSGGTFFPLFFHVFFVLALSRFLEGRAAPKRPGEGKVGPPVGPRGDERMNTKSCCDLRREIVDLLFLFAAKSPACAPNANSLSSIVTPKNLKFLQQRTAIRTGLSTTDFDEFEHVKNL